MFVRSLAGVASFSCVVLILAACSSPDGGGSADPRDAGGDTTTGAEGGPSPVNEGGVDGATDAATDASPVTPVTGMLDVKAAGALATTVKLGALTPVSGSAQWRPNAGAGGGFLTVRLDEAAAPLPSRSIELTIRDDAGTLADGESFASAAPVGGPTLRFARVETYQSDGKAWRTDGDGNVKVVHFDAASVSLTFTNVGQFTQDAGGGTDVFVVDGTVTVPLTTFPAKSGGSASVTISNVANEPISNEPANLVSTSAISAATTTLSDLAYPFTSDRRSASFGDGAGSSARSVRVSFPSGHLPRMGRNVDLSKFDRVQVTYFEGAAYVGGAGEKVWEADQGTLSVEAATATSMTLKLTGARMQSESPAAKGVFDLDGTVVVALP